jgi:ATP-dependent DNA helicase PIF1
MFDKIDEPIVEFKLQTNRKCTTYTETGKPIDAQTLEKCMALTPLEIDYELEQLIANTTCIEKLELKRDSIVMCTANIDMENGICNGSQGIILDFASNGAPIVKFVNGLTKTLELHSWQSTEYPTISISQYPLQLAWALTIHKIQGATLDMAQIDVGNGIFEYGQTYVALSRIKTLDGLYLANFNPTRIKAHPKVKQFYENIAINQPLEMDTKTEVKTDVKIIKL